jgi:predicted MarR family transcription regulator
LTAGLLGSDYRPNQTTYDLRRLRLAGLIHRLPHTNRYQITAEGIHIAVIYTKIYNRLLVRSPPPTNPRHHPS